MKYRVHANLTGTYVTTVDADGQLDAIRKALKELEDSTKGKMTKCFFAMSEAWEQAEGEK